MADCSLVRSHFISNVGRGGAHENLNRLVSHPQRRRLNANRRLLERVNMSCPYDQDSSGYPRRIAADMAPRDSTFSYC